MGLLTSFFGMRFLSSHRELLTRACPSLLRAVPKERPGFAPVSFEKPWLGALCGEIAEVHKRATESSTWWLRFVNPKTWELLSRSGDSLKRIVSSGYEVSLHSEFIDTQTCCGLSDAMEAIGSESSSAAPSNAAEDLREFGSVAFDRSIAGLANGGWSAEGLRRNLRQWSINLPQWYSKSVFQAMATDFGLSISGELVGRFEGSAVLKAAVRKRVLVVHEFLDPWALMESKAIDCSPDILRDVYALLDAIGGVDFEELLRICRLRAKTIVAEGSFPLRYCILVL